MYWGTILLIWLISIIWGGFWGLILGWIPGYVLTNTLLLFFVETATSSRSNNKQYEQHKILPSDVPTNPNSVNKEYLICECGSPVNYPTDKFCKKCNLETALLSTLVRKELNVVFVDENLTCSCGCLVGHDQEFCPNCNSKLEFKN